MSDPNEDLRAEAERAANESLDEMRRYQKVYYWETAGYLILTFLLSWAINWGYTRLSIFYGWTPDQEPQRSIFVVLVFAPAFLFIVLGDRRFKAMQKRHLARFVALKERAQSQAGES